MLTVKNNNNLLTITLLLALMPQQGFTQCIESADLLASALAGATDRANPTEIRLCNNMTYKVFSEIDVTDKFFAVSCDGGGVGNCTIEADGQSRLFETDHPSHQVISFDGVTFQGNKNNATDSGGAFALWGGDTAFTSCVFLDFAVAGWGGAISAINPDTVLNITMSTFEGNNGRMGGAIHAELYSTVNVMSSMFIGNNVAGWGEVKGVEGWEGQHWTGWGGAISSSSSATVDIAHSTFVGNNARGWGGAIHVQETSTMNITSSTFEGNSAGEDGDNINMETIGWGTVNCNDGTNIFTDGNNVPRDLCEPVCAVNGDFCSSDEECCTGSCFGGLCGSTSTSSASHTGSPFGWSETTCMLLPLPTLLTNRYGFHSLLKYLRFR